MNLGYEVGQLRNRVLVEAFLTARKNGNVIPPKFIAWDCSRRCNLNCQHCGAKKEKYDISTELTLEQVKKFLKEAREYGVTDFSVTGGEPLLRKDIFEIFEYAKQLGFITGMSTNGFFVNDINAPKIAALFDTIQISLDGPEDVHSTIRGNPRAFAKAINAFELLKVNKARQLSVSSVITKTNLSRIDELASLVFDTIRPQIWKIMTVMPIGNAENNGNLSLDENEAKQLFETIRKDYKKKIRIDIGDNLGFLGSCDKFLRDQPFFCPIGFLAFCLGVDGKVRGCPEQPDSEYFYEGDIRVSNIKEIWEHGFEKYRNLALLDSPECANCKDKSACRGGCWVMKTKGQNCSKMVYNLG